MRSTLSRFFVTMPSFRVRLGLAAMLAWLTFHPASLRAEGLKSAQVSRVFNDVKLLPENQPPRPAAVTDTVSGKAAVQTGAASRTELMFSDKTLTRLGANSFFSFVNGTRDMNLGSGTMLLQVPKGAGGAEIHTAAVTAAITGTTLMVEFNPRSYSKIIVLEGTVRVFLTRHVGESVLVHAGQMVIVPPDSKTVPDPVSVDLKVLYATSGLINDFGPLASGRLIDHEITRQRQDIDGGKLADTNLFIVGRGTQVQEGHLSFVSGNDHSITARQGAHTPLGLNETVRSTPPPPTPPVVTPTPPLPPTPTPPVVTPTPPVVTPTPPVITPTPPVVTPTPPVVTPTPPVVTPTPPVVTPTPTPATPTPTPVPTATPPPTPTPTVTPTPSPSPSVPPTPTPPATPSKNGPLPLIANNASPGGTPAYAIDGTSAINTDPFITTQGVTDAGRIYRGGTVGNPATASNADGLPSSYFLGATGGPTAFDTQVGFDTQFGTVGDVGGFKFSVLTLTGNPASITTAGGPASLVFVATGNIQDFVNSTTGSVGTFDLRGLANVALVTQNGSITLDNGIRFTNSGPTATALTIYARSGGLLLGESTAITLPGSAVNLYSDGPLTANGEIGSTEGTGAGAINLISSGAMNLGGFFSVTGSITATTTTTGSGIALGADSHVFTGTGGDFNATSAGSITADGAITTGGDTRLVAANGVEVTGNITTGGNLRLKTDAGDITTDAASVFQLPGVFTAVATTGNLTLNGTVGTLEGDLVTPASANVTAGVSLTLGGTLIATDSIALTGTGGGTVTQSGGTIEAAGVNAQGTPSPGTVTVTTGSGDINLTGGTLRGLTVAVTSTSGNIIQGEDHELITGSNGGDAVVTSTQGTVTLGGTVTSAQGVQVSAGGDLSLTGASLTSGDEANVTLASTGGNTTLDADTSVAMSGGTFQATAKLTLEIDGTVGTFPEGEGGGDRASHLLPRENFQSSLPDYATGTGGAGVILGGAITTGTGAGGGGSAYGISFTATGGDLSVTSTGNLFASEGDIVLLSNNGKLTVDGGVRSSSDGDAAYRVTLTSSGDMTLNGTVEAAGDLQATSNNGALTTSGDAGVFSDAGNLTLFSSGDMTLGGNVFASEGSLQANTYNRLTVSGTVSAGRDFSLQSYFGALTINGEVDGGADSTLSATDKTNGTVAINGTVDVGANRLTIQTGTTFNNDPANSSITANDVDLTAGTTATFDLTRFHAGNPGPGGTLNVTAATINGSNAATSQPYQEIDLTATGPVTLTGFFNVTTLQAGNLTLTPNSTVSVTNLNTAGATGAVVIGDGGTFTLNAGTNANAVGPVSLDGSPLLKLFGSLAVSGAFSTTGSGQTPLVDLGTNVRLTATGSVSLGAGTLLGATGSTLGTNSAVTTTGSVTVDTLNAFGGLNVGNLAVRTLTLQNLGGTTAANPPDTVVSGSITPYALAGAHTFTVGRLTAGSINFAGTTAVGGSLDAASLTLTTKGNFGVGAGGVMGSVGSADFSGATRGVSTGGLVAGNGGTFKVIATANPAAANAPGAINVSSNGTTVVPVITSLGGTLTPVANGVPGTGGTGGTLTLNAADALSVGSGATVTAAGGNYQLASLATYTGGGANGGAGGTVGLVAGTTLTLTGGTGTAGTTSGPVTITAQGGSAIRSTAGTGGAGGTVGLQGGPAVALTNVLVNAAGGDVPAGTTVGNAPGGTITVTSTGTATPTATSVSLTGATLNASNGLSASTTQATGTGGTITILSQDLSATATPPPSSGVGAPSATGPSPTPVPPAILVSRSTVVASQQEPTPMPASSATPTPTPAYASKNGGTVNVTSKRVSGPGISVQDSSSLLALVDSRAGGTGGHVSLTTSGADIAVVGGSTVSASGANSTVTLDTGTTGGTITVTGSTVSTVGANGTFAGGGTVSLSSGAINLTSSTLSADLLKMQALGANGSIVINGGSVLSANTQLKLYATGSAGAITFQGGNITLSTGTLGAVLAAHSVTLTSGTVVTVTGGGGLQVFTTLANANYGTASGGNGNTTGLFENPAGGPINATPQTGTPPAFSSTAQPGAKPGKPAVPARVVTATPVLASRTGGKNPGRLLRQGGVTLLVEPVAPSRATALQNRAVLQSLAVTPGRTVEPGRAARPDRGTNVQPPVNRPGTNAAALRP